MAVFLDLREFHNIIFFFFFNDTATTEIYTLSLHDALPIYELSGELRRERGVDVATVIDGDHREQVLDARAERTGVRKDRKSTRLNSSHSQISYAVFCLKKKNRHMRCE